MGSRDALYQVDEPGWVSIRVYKMHLLLDKGQVENFVDISTIYSVLHIPIF